jgi:hypothetical protein
MIRPQIEALIKRGHVQIDEISPLNCSPEEAAALIPALTNIALSQRIARCNANTPNWLPTMPGYTLRALAIEAKLRLEAVPGNLPQYSNQELAAHIRLAAGSNSGPLKEYPQPGSPDFKGYIELLYMLSMNSAERLEGGF